MKKFIIIQARRLEFRHTHQQGKGFFATFVSSKVIDSAENIFKKLAVWPFIIDLEQQNLDRLGIFEVSSSVDRPALELRNQNWNPKCYQTVSPIRFEGVQAE